MTDIDSKEISRRDFLKLSGAALGSLLVPKGLTSLTSPPKKETLRNKEIFNIETPEATFFPVYEEHTKPISGSQLEELLPLDLYFYEYLEPSDKLVKSTANEIINYAPTLSRDPTAGLKRPFIIMKDQLDVLIRNNIYIGVEGYEVTSEMELSTFGFQGLEGIVGSFGAIKRFLIDETTGKRKAYKASDENYKIKDAAVALAATWAVSPTLVERLFFYGDAEIKQNAIDRIMSRIAAITTHAHPEYLLILFRNILMARKLQFLGENLSKHEKRKANIAYNVGKMHGGIEDFLKLGKEFTLHILEKFPDEPIKNIIDRNGGLDNFCSTIVMNPGYFSSSKQVIVDQELKTLLQKKIK